MDSYLPFMSVLTNILFVLCLGFYLITNLQWYDYRLERVVFKHHKRFWHIFYFIIPFIAYFTTGVYFFIFFYFAYLPALFVWHKKLDKKLVWTSRVKRFFALLLALVMFQDFLCYLKHTCEIYGVFIPLVLAYVGSMVIENYLFTVYKKEAKKKLNSVYGLKIITITASYGKTSIKNFVHQILSAKYNCYKTPRSVNTIKGIVADINQNLPQNTDFYITEAGARERGDIYQIATFLNPETVVVGKVGEAHIEYFKTIENIKQTKMELFGSKNLKKAFIHCSVTDEPNEKVEFFCEEDIKDLSATLDGLRFKTEINNELVEFEAPNILGGFNALNILAAIKVALYYGLETDEIKKAVKKLQPVEHRLQLIKAGGKFILDDGFNGNIDGVSEAIRLCSLHNGRKVIVTPGLVESTDELNIKLAKKINEVFDIAIITGSLNSELFDRHINIQQKIILKDKSNLQDILGKITKEGDIILFANDAPNFI